MQKGFEVVNLHGTASAVIAVPTIGENGNWFIGNEDTGVAAQGPQGNPGPSGGGAGADGTPVGTVIAYMGTEAPQHFLVCDGSEIAIADYPYLSQQILHEFGAVNYFGGDGVATFAVPDLRNEFLRGYHCKSDEQLSGEIGIHQDATIHSNVCTNGIAAILVNDVEYYGNNDSRKPDNVVFSNRTRNISTSITTAGARGFSYTSRPVNMAVLYCIKFEPA